MLTESPRTSAHEVCKKTLYLCVPAAELKWTEDEFIIIIFIVIITLRCGNSHQNSWWFFWMVLWQVTESFSPSLCKSSGHKKFSSKFFRVLLSETCQLHQFWEHRRNYIKEFRFTGWTFKMSMKCSFPGWAFRSITAQKICGVGLIFSQEVSLSPCCSLLSSVRAQRLWRCHS